MRSVVSKMTSFYVLFVLCNEREVISQPKYSRELDQFPIKLLGVDDGFNHLWLD